MAIVINGTTGISGVDGSASVPTLVGADTNTGIYFPAADRIGFAEGGTQVGEFDASGNFLFNSGYGSAAIGYGCRAWVNFNGTGTVAIRGSGNVSSITDNGTGNYTVNFTTAMPDANYGATVGFERSRSSAVYGIYTGIAVTASSYQISTSNTAASPQDFEGVNIAISR